MLDPQSYFLDIIIVGCLDTLTSAQSLSLTVYEEEKEKEATTKVYTKEDFSTVNRFESKFQPAPLEVKSCPCTVILTYMISIPHTGCCMQYCFNWNIDAL